MYRMSVDKNLSSWSSTTSTVGHCLALLASGTTFSAGPEIPHSTQPSLLVGLSGGWAREVRYCGIYCRTPRQHCIENRKTKGLTF